MTDTTETNPYLRRLAAKPRNSHGKVSEARLAKSLGARLTLNSGATKADKGDMRFVGKRKIRLEAKSTIHASMTLELAWLVKIKYEAMSNDSIAALAISFVTREGKALPNGEWVMVPKTVFQEHIVGDE